jgi:hypothetical protein
MIRIAYPKTKTAITGTKLVNQDAWIKEFRHSLHHIDQSSADELALLQ